MTILAGMAVSILCQWQGSQVVISPDDNYDRYELRFHNAETMVPPPDGQRTCAVDTPSGTMYIIWDHTTIGPDVINIVPPPGFYVDTPEVIIEENSDAHAWLYPWLVS